MEQGTLRTETTERAEEQSIIARDFQVVFDELLQQVALDRKCKQTQDDAILNELRGTVNEIRAQFEQERAERIDTEQALLTMLEETCS